MVRIAVTNILLFLTPFVLFALYLRFGRRVDAALSGWSTRALGLCLLAGVLLVAGSLYLFEAQGRGPTTGRYVPPTWDGEKLVPGHVE